MRKLRNITRKQNWIVLVLGMVLGIFVLYANQCGIDSNEVADSTDQQEATVSDLNYEAVQSASQISLERNSYLIEIIPEILEIDEVIEKTNELLPSPAKVFEVLFEHIVSPNSP